MKKSETKSIRKKAVVKAKVISSQRTAQLISIGRASELLGVHHDTLRDWERKGKISPVKTPGSHRRYSMSDINGMRGIVDEDERKSDGKVRVACYCRVSSHEQKEKGDLERQMGRVLAYCVDKKYEIVDRYEEVSSGMADVRCKLKQLFRLVEERKIDKVVIEHRDRLCRFITMAKPKKIQKSYGKLKDCLWCA